MIDHDKLKSALAAEVAANSWWEKLTPEERKAYIKAHPKSKFANKMGKPAVVKTGRPGWRRTQYDKKHAPKSSPAITPAHHQVREILRAASKNLPGAKFDVSGGNGSYEVRSHDPKSEAALRHHLRGWMHERGEDATHHHFHHSEPDGSRASVRLRHTPEGKAQFKQDQLRREREAAGDD